jgi:hypothetical protein
MIVVRRDRMQLQRELNEIQEGLTKQYPNLKSDDYLELAYILIGYIIGRGFFAALEFSLDNNDHFDELADLSNGYIELKDGTLTMSVTKLENFEEILQASYISSNSIHIIRK